MINIFDYPLAIIEDTGIDVSDMFDVRQNCVYLNPFLLLYDYKI